jgi:hypothetical protein
VLLGLVALGGTACGERTPTSLDPALIPVEPTSVEVILPWEEFGSNLRVFGGYGRVSELGTGMVARSFAGALDARTLVRFFELATSATVVDSSGTSVTDTLLSLRGGRLVAFVDTAASVIPGPVTFELGVLGQRWHPASASWSLAVDTLGEQVAWTEPGAGPVKRVATAVWDPSRGDSVVFFLDTTAVKLFRDTSDVRQGAVLGLVTPGARLALDQVALRATVKSSRRDTIFDISAGDEALTFVYTPEPGPPGDVLRVGGAPAWRTTLEITVPSRLTGPPSLCAVAGCPVELTAGRVNYAALVLSARSTEAAFRPADSLGIDVRAVYDPSALPKSPLGSGLIGGLGKRLAPELFGAGEGTEVEIPITSFVRALLQGDTVAGFPPPRTLAVLSALEPSSLAFASFYGPASSAAPKLRLIVSTSRAVGLP